MALTMGATTDALVELAEQATSGLQVCGQPVLVQDGWPDEAEPVMFIVGISDPSPEISGSTVARRDRVTLGANLIWESYDIPCLIWVQQGGVSTTAKAVRDGAEAVFNAFWALVAPTPDLGQLVGGQVQISQISASGQLVGTAAEPGRRQLLSFTATCTDMTT